MVLQAPIHGTQIGFSSMVRVFVGVDRVLCVESTDEDSLWCCQKKVLGTKGNQKASSGHCVQIFWELTCNLNLATLFLGKQTTCS